MTSILYYKGFFLQCKLRKLSFILHILQKVNIHAIDAEGEKTKKTGSFGI